MATLNAGAPTHHRPAVRRVPRRTSTASGRISMRSGVPYRLEPGLVRGLDYYTRTAFEYYHRGARRASSRRWAVAAATTGSSSCSAAARRPASGSGSGWTGCVLALEEQGAAASADHGPVAVVVGADPADTVARLRIATDLRAAGIAARAELAPRKLGKQLEAAARDQAHFAVIVGDELADGEVQLRDLPAGTQKVVPVGGPGPRGPDGPTRRIAMGPEPAS